MLPKIIYLVNLRVKLGASLGYLFVGQVETLPIELIGNRLIRNVQDRKRPIAILQRLEPERQSLQACSTHDYAELDCARNMPSAQGWMEADSPRPLPLAPAGREGAAA